MKVNIQLAIDTDSETIVLLRDGKVFETYYIDEYAIELPQCMINGIEAEIFGEQNESDI